MLKCALLCLAVLISLRPALYGQEVLIVYYSVRGGVTS